MPTIHRVIFIADILVAVLATASSSAFAQERDDFDCSKCDDGRSVSAPVIVYEHPDFQGRHQGFRPGSYRADRGQLDEVGNDTISSLKVADGYTARLCQHEGDDGRGAGVCQTFGPGQHNVSDELNDETSFIEVKARAARAPRPKRR